MEKAYAHFSRVNRKFCVAKMAKTHRKGALSREAAAEFKPKAIDMLDEPVNRQAGRQAGQANPTKANNLQSSHKQTNSQHTG